jgi:hypothetical protein
MCIAQYDVCHHFPTVVIQNENKKSLYLCEVLLVRGFLNTTNVHPAAIHKHIVQCMESVKWTEKM